MVKEVALSTGEIALVDDEDFPVVSRYSWRIVSQMGYAGTTVIFPDGTERTLYMHQLILATSRHIDHENHNTLDNQKSNIRVSTYQENGWNTRKRMVTCTGKPPSSIYKGVTRCEGVGGRVYWRALIKLSKKGETPAKFVRMGPFDTEIAAALAYNEEIVKHRGKWACLNEIAA